MKRKVNLSASAVLNAGEAPDVAFVPPLVRRRLSPLQKIHFALANAVGAIEYANAVFASRDGEDTLTRQLVDAFHQDGTVSPHKFSASVYNAAPGLWSVFTKNRSPYTAVAAGDDTIECGLIEALCGVLPTLFIIAEETGGGYGAALVFGDAANGRSIEVSEGDASRGPISFEALSSFIAGETNELCGRWISLKHSLCDD
jgi:hypothetical protein